MAGQHQKQFALQLKVPGTDQIELHALQGGPGHAATDGRTGNCTRFLIVSSSIPRAGQLQVVLFAAASLSRALLGCAIILVCKRERHASPAQRASALAGQRTCVTLALRGPSASEAVLAGPR